MARPIIMPQVGQDLKTARILEWRVRVGETINKGDIIALVESDKASFEVEAFEAGTILQLLYSEGDEAEVFKPIAFMAGPDEPAINPEQENSMEKPFIAPSHRVSGSSFKSTPQDKIHINTGHTDITQKRRPIGSPSARRLAKENKLDISGITGSGPSGRIIKRDITTALENRDHLIKISPLAEEIAKQENVDISSLTGTGIHGKILKSNIFEYIIRNKRYFLHEEAKLTPSDETDQEIFFSKMRRRISEKLTLSKETKPHFYLFADMDLTIVLQWKGEYEARNNLKISLTDIIIQTVSKTLVEFPRLNAFIDSEKIILKKNINIGMAVALEDGLLVPVIPNADQKSIDQIALSTKFLAENAKKGIVDIRHEGTFTITNLGMYGIKGFQAIINPPECAILSVGAVEKRIIPGESGILVRDYFTAGLACDHRAVDGAYGAAFLKTLNEKFIVYPNI